MVWQQLAVRSFYGVGFLTDTWVICYKLGNVGPRNDFVCNLDCRSGEDAFIDLFPNRTGLPPWQLFDPAGTNKSFDPSQRFR